MQYLLTLALFEEFLIVEVSKEGLGLREVIEEKLDMRVLRKKSDL